MSRSSVLRHDTPSRPAFLILSHIQTGHLTPNLRIAAGLVQRGWAVFFLGPTAEVARISRSGATFLPLLGAADIHDEDLAWKESQAESVEARVAGVAGVASVAGAATDPRPMDLVEPLSFLPPADVRTVVDTVTQCFDTVPAQWTSVVAALRTIQAAYGSQQPRVVVLCDAFFHGLLPLYCGAALPPDVQRPLSSVCISVTPPMLRSVGLPPFGLALEFDPTAAGRAASAAAWERWTEATAPVAQVLHDRIREAGGVRGLDPAEWPFASGANYLLHPGGVSQLGVSGFEYPRPDWPDRFRFAGILPPDWKPSMDGKGLPRWWDEVADNSSLSPPYQKKIVVVTQGTFQIDLADLVLPTLAALASSPDVLVVAILGRRNAQLPPPRRGSDTEVPANARIADFLHYDAVLPHAHAWVHNGGFGAVTHGIAHGVPMVVAGEGQDKAENARRVAWSGIGVDLGTSRPDRDGLRRAIEAVLHEGKHRDRIAVLQSECRGLDTIAAIETALLEAAASQP